MGLGLLMGLDPLMGRSHAGGHPPAQADAEAGARTSRPRARCDRGFATAEIAVALPSLVLVALMLAWVVALLTAQLQCVDAARAGARAVSRGESTAASEVAALAAAPRGATVVIIRTGDSIEVRVSADIEPAGGMAGFLPTATVGGVAHTIAEDAVGAWGTDGPVHRQLSARSGHSSARFAETHAGESMMAGHRLTGLLSVPGRRA